METDLFALISVHLRTFLFASIRGLNDFLYIGGLFLGVADIVHRGEAFK
jgi:hypothetical protein